MKMKMLAIAAIVAGTLLGATRTEAIREKLASGDRDYVFVANGLSTSVVEVGSYNIRTGNADSGTPNAWDARKSDVAAMIRKMDLDAFGLQEVDPGQAEFLNKELPEYGMVGEYSNADRRSGAASPVFYRKDRFAVEKSGTFWLSETPDVPGKKGWGAAFPRVCAWALLRDRRSGKSLVFANTHTDHKSELARKEGMLLIIRRMREFAPEGTPIVFTGDHNCRETEAPAVAVSEILTNALYVSKTTPEGPWRTYNAWKWRENEFSTADALKLSPTDRNASSACGGPRIDYIYVSKGVEVLEHKTHADARPGTKLYPSDHFPVTARIILPD